MAFVIALAAFIMLPVSILLAVNFNNRRLHRKFAQTEEGKQMLRQQSRKKIELAFNTYSVFPLADDKWLVRQEKNFAMMHFVVNDKLKILANTNEDGIISPLSKDDQLLIQVRKGGIQTKKGWRAASVAYGVMDASFSIKIPATSEHIELFNKGFLKVSHDGLHGIYSSCYSLLLPIEFESIIQDDANERFIAEKTGLYYLYDYKGHLVQELTYTSVYLNQIDNQTYIKAFVAEGQYYSSHADDDQIIRGKWGLLDGSYQETIPIKYNLLYNGPHAVLVMDGTLSIDDTVTPWPGMDKFYHATGGRWGVRGFNDEILIPTVYDWIDFTCSDQYFLINNSGQMFYLRMDDEPGFWGILGGKWGLINVKNKIVIPADYDVVHSKDHQLFFQKIDTKIFDEDLPYTVFELPIKSLDA